MFSSNSGVGYLEGWKQMKRKFYKIFLHILWLDIDQLTESVLQLKRGPCGKEIP